MTDAEIIQGHVLDVLAGMPAESVSCMVTSPPYYSLRKYDAPDVTWGGDPECPHTLAPAPMAGEGYGGSRRWQHEGVSRQETPDAWVKEKRYQGCIELSETYAQMARDKLALYWRPTTLVAPAVPEGQQAMGLGP